MCAYVDETSHALLQRPHPRTRSWIAYSFGLREPVVIELRRERIVGASNVMEYTVVVVIDASFESTLFFLRFTVCGLTGPCFDQLVLLSVHAGAKLAPVAN